MNQEQKEKVQIPQDALKQIGDLIKVAHQVNNTIRKKVEGKNIIMFTGNTGVGKSTLINALIGNELEATTENLDENSQSDQDDQDDQDDQNSQDDQPEFYLEQKSQGKQGPKIAKPNSNVSETDQIDLYYPKNNIIQKLITNIYYCDTPGLRDNRGHQQEIKNTISIKTLMESAGSLKIILVICQNQLKEAKHQKLLDLISRFSPLFKKFEKEYFCICVTKYRKNSCKKVKKVFKGILNDDKLKLKQEEIKFCQFVMSQCQILTFRNPEKQGPYSIPQQLIQKILKMQGKPSSPPNLKCFRLLSPKTGEKINQIILNLRQYKFRNRQQIQNIKQALIELQHKIDGLKRNYMSVEEALEGFSVYKDETGKQVFKILLVNGIIVVSTYALAMISGLGIGVIIGTAALQVALLTFSVLTGPIGIVIGVGATALVGLVKYFQKHKQQREKATKILQAAVTVFTLNIDVIKKINSKLQELEKQLRIITQRQK